MKSDEEKNENRESEAKAWLPELSFTTVLSIVGIGFTAFDMFMRYRQKEDNKNRIPRFISSSTITTNIRWTSIS